MKTPAFILAFFSICGMISCSHTAAVSKSSATIDPATDSNWVFTATVVGPRWGIPAR